MTDLGSRSDLQSDHKWATNLDSRKEMNLESHSDLKSVLDSVCTSLQEQEGRSLDPKLARLVRRSGLLMVCQSVNRLDSDSDLQTVHLSDSRLVELERRSERNSDFHSERSKALHLERQWVLDLDLKSDHW